MNLLSTIMRCGECGGPMKVRCHKIGVEKVHAYACSNYAIGRKGCRNSLRRPVDLVNETVIGWLLANILRGEHAALVLDAVEQKLVGKAQEERGNSSALEGEASKARARIANLTDAIAEAPQDVRSVLYAKLREEKGHLNALEQRIRDAARTPSTLRAEIERLRADALHRLAVFHDAVRTTPALARRFVAAAFPKGIVASPVVRGKRRRFWLDGEASFGVLFTGDTGGPTGIPNVASPTGFEPVLAA